MNRPSWKTLVPGDMIQNLSNGARYVLTQKGPSIGWIGVRTLFISDPGQWRRVTKDEKEKLS